MGWIGTLKAEELGIRKLAIGVKRESRTNYASWIILFFKFIIFFPNEDKLLKFI